jgi:hypothetical protein
MLIMEAVTAPDFKQAFYQLGLVQNPLVVGILFGKSINN